MNKKKNSKILGLSEWNLEITQRFATRQLSQLRSHRRLLPAQLASLRSSRPEVVRFRNQTRDQDYFLLSANG